MTLSSDSPAPDSVAQAEVDVGPDVPQVEPSRVRNVGICAHIDAGKTTLTERILHLTGRERHVGRVDEGTSVMDWMSEERERGITIVAAATRVSWGQVEINLVDTPGHVDFTVEVERSMRILDGAVLVLDAAKGVEPQTETVWRQVEQQAVTAIAFANKCERPGADVLACAASIQERLLGPGSPVRAVVVAYPVGGGDLDEPLSAVVDLVMRRAHGALRAPAGGPGPAPQVQLPAAIADEVDVLRAELVDVLGDLDEALFEVIVEGREPTGNEIAAALRRQTLARRVIPVFCGAALLGQGVGLLLDAIGAYLPAPTEVPVPPLFHADDASAPVSGAEPPEPLALVFKVHSTKRRGRRSDLTFVRIYAGEIFAGMRLWNDRAGETEIVQGVLRIHASEVTHIGRAGPGEVVALSGLHVTGTGDTLVPEGCRLRLEPPQVPAPVLGYQLEPARDEDRPLLGEALDRLAREDPSLRLGEDPQSGQWVLEGMGELHLEIALARLQSEYGVEPRRSSYRIAFREVVQGAVSGSGEIEQAFGEDHAHAQVDLRVEPHLVGAAGRGLTVDFDPGIGLETSRRRAMRRALLAEAQSGPLAGHPLRGARILVTRAESPDGSNVEVAWEQAAVAALRDAMKAASAAALVLVMEPTMEFVVETPVDVSGGVIGDLNSRHATMDEVISTGTDSRRVTGRAPLRALLGYSTALRSLSKGRATFSMRPAEMAPFAGEVGGAAGRLR